MKKYQNNILLIALVIIMCICFTACGNSQNNVQSENQYRVYYLNEAGTKAEKYFIETEEKDPVKLVKLMFNSMKEVNVSGATRAIPDGITFDKAEISGDILYLYIKGSLEGINAGRIMMFYASLTRSFSQLSEVSGIMVFINGESAIDPNGRTLGIMRESRFVNNAIDDPDDYKESEVILYFADKNKDKLKKTVATASYRSSTPIERVVVEQLIAGPADDSANQTISNSVTLLSINVSDKVCYVNFDNKFITETVSGYDNIPVYSVVNSLIELDGIESVQISINGANDVSMPMGNINFQNPFTFNDELVEIE